MSGIDGPARAAAAILGLSLIAIVLQDGFEVVLLAKAVGRQVRLVRLAFRSSWAAWSCIAARFEKARREHILAVYGPLAMLMMFGLWATGLILGFGLLRWGLRPTPGPDGLDVAILDSANSFFTLGAGTAAQGRVALFVSVAEAGLGFGCIGLMIGYLPVLYGHFCERDALLIRLRARAGRPPTVHGMLEHRAKSSSADHLGLLRSCEKWAADLLESHVSYFMLAFYRSQHSDQSWLATLAVLLDTCAIIRAAGATEEAEQAKATYFVAFAVIEEIARSFAGDLGAQPGRSMPLPRITELIERYFDAEDTRKAADEAGELCERHAPFLAQLSAYLMLPLPEDSPT